MSEELEEYILKHISDEPAHLSQLHRDTHLYRLYPRMCSGHLQGRLLKMLVRLQRPERVLELGTFTGYSAQCLAEGLLSPTAHVHTIEIEDELEDFIIQHLESSPYAHQISLHIGNATQIFPTLGNEPWDLVFIDANKRHYPQYYEMIIPHLRPGGLIIADNTLWDGKVANPGDKVDAQTAGILEFNNMVAADPRVEVVILPLRDGLTLIYKK